MSTATALRATSWPSVPGFQVLGLLGEGGMGRVYLARQVHLDRRVALKLLAGAGGGPPDALARARFRVEAALMARVRHPNILAVYECADAEPLPYLVLELADGGSLRQRMTSGQPLGVERILDILGSLASALEAIHAHRIIHGDLKPENILLATDGRPMIADFGVARALDDPTDFVVPPRVGTHGYAAPELRFGLPVDPRADQYGLAALVYELATGKAPVGVVRPPTTWNPELPSPLDAALIRALADDPDDRFGSLAEFVAAAKGPGAQVSRSTPSIVGRRRFLLGGMAAAAGLTFLVGDRGSSARSSDRTKARSSFPRDIGLDFVHVPAGRYLRGASSGDPRASKDEGPAHPVVLRHGFEMARTETTFRQFREFVDETGYTTDAERLGIGSIWNETRKSVVATPGLSWRSPGLRQPPRDEDPVVQVTRADAMAFCNWLGRVDPSAEYRLPTEAEWEYACRAGTSTIWWFGDDPASLAECAWTRENSGRQPQQVGQKAPNPWGLHDMYGNVGEICLDDYAPAYMWVEPLPFQRDDRRRSWVVRGGSWSNPEPLASMRSSARGRRSYPYVAVGFRVVRVQPSSGLE